MDAHDYPRPLFLICTALSRISHSIHPDSSLGCLEALGLNLGLGSRDGSLGVGVDESAALLAVLELGADARADAGALAVVGAAALLAIGVGDATSRGELPALAVSDVTGSSRVGDGLSVDGGSN
jgi:hypothetical protein